MPQFNDGPILRYLLTATVPRHSWVQLAYS